MDEYLLCLNCGVYCEAFSVICPVCCSDQLISEDEYNQSLRDSGHYQSDWWIDEETEDTDNA